MTFVGWWFCDVMSSGMMRSEVLTSKSVSSPLAAARREEERESYFEFHKRVSLNFFENNLEGSQVIIRSSSIVAGSDIRAAKSDYDM
ncbi:hypothetical protein KIL84_022579 [Mauremys mutica]|uniref:Uncharacterized protein n=1 Tax=Mauremys mutica TaxID=74926 RepID=A0A9D3WQ29_9SAUR|nr:hypothetical protein KIL84_022579 [Mauremys mutica]